LEAPRAGRDILNIKDLTHSYEDNILFLGAFLELEPGERIAFLGPNGSGKSTLLRLIMGLEEPDEGSITIGKYNIIPSYFEQNQAEALELEKTVIETISQSVPDWTQTEIRSLLGSFGLTNDSVFKEVSQISGGEKARLALALMIIKPSNLLILDEPTNHLDIPSKQMLEQALSNYNGTALIVSHDRYFISKVANKIVEIRDGQLIKYQGDYKYYKEKKIEEAQEKEKELQLAERERKRLANREKQRRKKKTK
jgi:ATP-binding cassette subfamily F protein 3